MNGCPKFWKLKVSCLALLLSLIQMPTVSLAQETSAQELPSPEMLDFLGLFNDEETGWVDPFELLAIDDDVFLRNDEQEEDKDE